MSSQDHIFYQTVSRSFDRVAHQYEAFAKLQAWSASHLLEQLSLLRSDPNIWLDLGSGTGFMAQGLLDKSPGSQVLSVDLALGMLLEQRRLGSAVNCIQANADYLPIADGSVDCIVSNLMLQWILDPLTCFAECRRVLVDQGCLFMSTLGPASCHELQFIWQKIGVPSKQIPLPQPNVLVDSLDQLGFRDVVVSREVMTCYFDTPIAVLKHFSQIGANAVWPGQQGHVLNRSMLRDYEKAYKDHFSDAQQGFPLTFELLYLHAWSGANENGKDVGLQEVSLDAIKGLSAATLQEAMADD